MKVTHTIEVKVDEIIKLIEQEVGKKLALVETNTRTTAHSIYDRGPEVLESLTFEVVE